MHGFITGDRVRVIRAYDSSLPLGAEFTITGVGTGSWDGWIAVNNGLCEFAVDSVGLWPGGYWHDRFEKVTF